MRTLGVTGIVAAAGLISIGAQQPQKPLTVRGEIVEVSCYSKLGAEKGTGPEHVACAKECAGKGQPLAILTDGDGLLKITGDYAANKYGKLASYIGREVEATGTPDRFTDYSRAIRITKLTPVRAAK
jgi:hypothetical protein